MSDQDNTFSGDESRNIGSLKPVEYVDDISEHKVDSQMAEKEVNRWLEFKRVGQSRRLDNQQFIDTIKSAIEEGDLTLDNDCVFKLGLKFIVGDTPSLSFQPRANFRDLKNRLSKVKITDIEGRYNAIIACLTGKGIGIIEGLDTEDRNTCQAIASFFL